MFPDRGWSLTVLMGLRHLQISAGSVWSTTDVFNSRPLWAHHSSPWRLTLAAYQPESGLQDSIAGLEVCSRCRSSLPQGPLHSRCIPFVEGRQHLQSAATGALLVPRAQTATGQRSYAVNGPTVWNSLPQHYVRRICRRTPSSGHWRRISSHPSSDTESFSRLCRCL